MKLDTNGTNPDMLIRAVEEGAVDYVAMDIKNSPENYGMSVGIKNYDTAKIKRSVKYLLEDHVDYEFRTTVVREFNDKTRFTASPTLSRARKNIIFKHLRTAAI